MIRIKHSGDFSKTTKFLNKILKRDYLKVLQKYAEQGVLALKNATPVDTGKTSESWGYEISQSNGKYIITWTNDNIAEYVPVAIIIQYGHATKNGGYVEGIDFINPAMKPIFDKMANDAWKEVTQG